ncbi:MAG: APC family permease [Dehalococcoidia bacterium]
MDSKVSPVVKERNEGGLEAEAKPYFYRPDYQLQAVEGKRTEGSEPVRVMMLTARGFTEVAPGVLEATEAASAPRGEIGHRVASVKRVLVGRPLATAEQEHERLTKVKALAVFSSDALSSVAYATEEILLVLAAAGAAALSGVLPISLAIVLLLAIVALSYRQTIHAYPSGGGSYIVAKDNLGNLPGLTAGAALMIDYVLTVAVSISSGVAAVTSAVQGLHSYALEISLVALAFMMITNLRGIRDSGTIFAAPTYLFISSIFLLIAVGIVKVLLGGLSGHNLLVGAPPSTVVHASQNLTIFLILRAFASGCTAMTGVEAVSNGVPAFKRPESQNAARTLEAMALILGVMFLGIGLLAHHFGLVPNSQETILSQLGHRVFIGGPLYYILQATTFLILVLAANTSFADFPRLSSIMARDNFLPHQFTFRGDRLAFTNGIIVLSILAGLLLIIFDANTDRLIPLYAVGVFLSFTLSQSGMVRHWLRERGPNWQRSMTINGTGAVVTAAVTLIIAATKFTHGAWVVVLLIPCLVVAFYSIYHHYNQVAEQLEVEDLPKPLEVECVRSAIVPIAGLSRPVVRTLAYARGLSEDVTAVHVTDDRAEAEALRRRWEEWNPGVPLVILETPYRSFLNPLLTYIDTIEEQSPGCLITVVLPEFVPAHWWERLLHNQTALRLKLALLSRPNTVVTDVPYHLR